MTPQEIEQIVDMLAEKLGPIGGQVWSIYVKQVYVSVAMDMLVAVACLLALIGGLLGLRWSMRHYKEAKAANPHDYMAGEYQVSGIIASAMIAGASGFMLLVVFPSIVKLLNPEYYAIQMLLGR